MFDPLGILHDFRIALRARYVRGPVSQALYEFITFGVKQAWACLFGGLLLALILLTHFFYPADAVLARYDFLTLGAITIQVSMLLFRLETLQEAKIILIFHVVGTVMEIFKTHMGSWLYPEPSVLRIGDVPLFSGFMYACVGSYIARVWRLFDFQFTRFPPLWAQAALAAAIYVNFFTHHYGADIRLGLFLAAGLLYGPSVINFKPDEDHRPMPLLLGLFLVYGQLAETGKLVSTDDYQLCFGGIASQGVRQVFRQSVNLRAIPTAIKTPVSEPSSARIIGLSLASSINQR